MHLRTSAPFVAAVAGLACLWSCSSGSSGGGSSASTAAPTAATPAATTTATSSGTPPAATSQSVVSGNVSIPYVLTDPASAPQSVAVDYSTDGGATWSACSQGLGGDPKTNLASSPSGVAHTFVWDTVQDLGANLVPGVVVRITPTGKSSAQTQPFTVDNLAFATPTAKVTITRGPYLQATTHDAVTIVWRTLAPSDTVVEYGPGTSFGHRAGNAQASETKHAVTITNLTGGTSYSYRILSGGAVATLPSTFSTAAEPTAPAFTALVFGDSGSGTQWQLDLAARMANESFDLALHTGDVIYPDGAEKDYDPNFFRPYGPWLKSRPIFPAMGNHDQMTANGQAYMDAFVVNANNPQGDKRYYSFEWGNAKFISIESVVLFTKPGPHLTWLQNELASNTRRWLVVFMHVPLYSVGFHGDSATLQNLLGPIFEQYKVDLVLQGHDHNYERTAPIKRFSNDPKWQGVPYIVTGGGGGQWYPVLTSHAQTIYSEAVYHYTLLTFTNDAIKGRMVRVDGTQGESFAIPHQ